MVAQAGERLAQFELEFPERLAHQVAQFVVLEQVPEAIRRVEVWRIGGQSLQMEALTGIGGQEVLDGLAVMDRGAVPEHQQGAGEVLEELAQEAHDLGARDGMGVRAGEDPALLGERADDREMIATERRPQHRRLSARCPRPPHRWQQGEPGLIYPYERASLRFGLCFKAGQRSCHHRAMAAASRWLAGQAGFCTLQLR